MKVFKLVYLKNVNKFLKGINLFILTKKSFYTRVKLFKLHKKDLQSFITLFLIYTVFKTLREQTNKFL